MPPDDQLRDDTRLTALLDAAASGDRDAFGRAYALLYDELSALARAQRRRWVGNDTVNTSVLVHEAYLKLLGDDAGPPSHRTRWQGRRHFFALAAQVMRQVLVNYAEERSAAKRGGTAERVPLETIEQGVATPDPEWLHDHAHRDGDEEEILLLHAALKRLQDISERQARIVECRFFAGLSIPATAEALGISPATVKREWNEASRWLYAELTRSRVNR